MKIYGGLEVHLHTFLISAVDGGEWSASCPSCFTTRESPWNPMDRRLCGYQSWSGCSDKEMKFLPPLGINPGCPACSLVSIPTELPWLHATSVPT